MKLSIIIPTLHEENAIASLVAYLRQHSSNSTEIIVADGGSADATCSVATAAGATVLSCNCRGRAAQMNQGAQAASGDVLYFLHADTFPPPQFEQSISQAIGQGVGSGCFRLKFDDMHWFLRLNAWFTRFDLDAIRFGDQSLFVKKEVFAQAGGFDERLYLLEDQEIISRLRRMAPFKVLSKYVTTSARKYKQVGVYWLQGGYFLIYGLYRLGLSQKQLVRVYKWLVKG
ncbi:TIGR04283 family arsenosugar biosynthesis glycosyltransferase [Pontibacter cellulosilyticus]|uniref:TIGR04283 family arsenosugar biosynthesis glycosyltransferase n=1 Tax=Pontibacter cellulosilyticus TaxID=1720253 RepID=A0A923SJ69_9BACT|nr:TIGR04283 family arsenosugar biosynthesis glycosyltransferase [Pontibacter cellulosilyticus]MBC5993503.1 TIGR04283 family arsenosugar biosynthesis glycosyltransferase [Pontibacter cellulosilyticus]